MKTIVKKISLGLIILTSLIVGCERDDICPEDTSTTPMLIIRFYDIEDTDETKSVRQLTVVGEGLSEEYELVSSTNTDSIALPLKFGNEGETAISRFELKKDSDYDDNDDASNSSNTDIIEISYTPEFVYVSRACGYKSIFNATEVNIDETNDNDVWIQNIIEVKTTVENENEAHIHIFH